VYKELHFTVWLGCNFTGNILGQGRLCNSQLHMDEDFLQVITRVCRVKFFESFQMYIDCLTFSLFVHFSIRGYPGTFLIKGTKNHSKHLLPSPLQSPCKNKNRYNVMFITVFIILLYPGRD